MDFSSALEKLLGGYVAAFAVLIVGLCWLIWKLASYAKEVNLKLDDIKNLPCSDHSAKINEMSSICDKLKSLPCERHTSEINNTSATLAKIEGEVGLLVKLATMTRPETIQSATMEYSEKHSPRKLNSNGVKLFNDISGNQFLSDNKDYLLEKIALLSPKTALDVENFALSVLRASSNEDIFIPLKNWVYNAPSRELTRPDGEKVTAEVSIDDVYFVLSLPLRDMYLERHPLI